MIKRLYWHLYRYIGMGVSKKSSHIFVIESIKSMQERIYSMFLERYESSLLNSVLAYQYNRLASIESIYREICWARHKSTTCLSCTHQIGQHKVILSMFEIDSFSITPHSGVSVWNTWHRFPKTRKPKWHILFNWAEALIYEKKRLW